MGYGADGEGANSGKNERKLVESTLEHGFQITYHVFRNLIPFLISHWLEGSEEQRTNPGSFSEFSTIW